MLISPEPLSLKRKRFVGKKLKYWVFPSTLFPKGLVFFFKKKKGSAQKL